jgi:hypothetical protein
MNIGLTESRFIQVFDLIEKNVSRGQADAALKELVKIAATKQVLVCGRLCYQKRKSHTSCFRHVQQIKQTLALAKGIDQ